ncbi:uncharacterized protein LOC144434366 [Glandiceps talaboti]
MLASLTHALRNITQFFVGDSIGNHQRKSLKRSRTPDSESDIEIVEERFGGPRKKHRRNDERTIVFGENLILRYFAVIATPVILQRSHRQTMDGQRKENGSSNPTRKLQMHDSARKGSEKVHHQYEDKIKKTYRNEESESGNRLTANPYQSRSSSRGNSDTSGIFPSYTKQHDTSVASKLFPGHLLGTVGRSKPMSSLARPRQYAITRPKMYGVEQSMRLEEKALYQNLLMQYTDAYRHAPKSIDTPRSQEQPTQAHNLDQTRIETELGSFIEKPTYTAERRVPHRQKVEAHVIPSTEKERSLGRIEDRFYQPLCTPYTGSTRSVLKKIDTPAQPDFEGASPQSMSPREVSLSDTLSRSSVINKFSKYCSEDWIKQLKSKYEASEREKLRQIEEVKVKLRIYQERRAEHEARLEEQIRDRMHIAEKEPPVLEDVEDTDEEESLPELTEEMENEIDNAFVANPREEILTEGFRLSITRDDIQTLSGLNWLNDEVINFYMNLLMKRGQDEGNLKVHAFNTFFYPKLCKDGYSSLRRWTRKVDIFGMDLVFVPVHLGMHWCLAVIDFRKKSITYYDSMGGNNMQCLNKLREYLKAEHSDKKKREYDIGDWQLDTIKDIPQQMNGSDCGMFACKYAEYISRDVNISFRQEHMPYFRRRMVWEILHQQLM